MQVSIRCSFFGYQTGFEKVTVAFTESQNIWDAQNCSAQGAYFLYGKTTDKPQTLDNEREGIRNR